MLGLDPGALRMGWAFVETGTPPRYVASGIYGLPREEHEEFRVFRHRLIRYWMGKFPSFLKRSPSKIISETIPAVGGGNFVVATQSELAKTAITTCQVLAFQRSIPWDEIAANTSKKSLTGSGLATKVGVRNAVTQAFPQLEARKKELTTYADESDAIGIALVGAGYKA